MDEQRARQRFLSLVTAGSMSMAVGVACHLRLPDLLAVGARSLSELARETASHGPSLHRLLRALCSLEVCTEESDGRFRLAPAGRVLRSDVPGSLRSWMMWWSRYMWPVWGALAQSVACGESARRLLTGAEGFTHLERDAEAAVVFNGAMAEFTCLVATELAARYDFSAFRRVVDVGGGHGVLIAALLASQPGLRGVILDLPHALPGARAALDAIGLAERCEIVAGDFFRSVPAGADLYLLKAVLHDWDDEQCECILRNCRRAIAPQGRLAIVERVMPERLTPCASHQAIARSDLNMLLAHGGRERSEAQFRTLLQKSGFRLARVVDTGLEYSLVEGVPA